MEDEHQIDLKPRELRETAWFQLSSEESLDRLQTGQDGLDETSAGARLAQFGHNTIGQQEEISPWQVLLNQFTDPLIYVLLAALVVTLAVQSYADAIVIAAVLVINATVGFIQEYKAENAVQALMQMVSPKARVRRNGESMPVRSDRLVPGDIVLLSEGSVVPADTRLIDVTGLQVNESALTGESVPVEKSAEALAEAEETLPPADQSNMAFMGTAVTSGQAVGVVVATGTQTEIGQIAEEVREAGESETPLQKRIARMTRWIAGIILSIALLVFLGGWLLGGREPMEMLLMGVGLSVAAIPAGLPIVVTVALAIGVSRMARREAVIRHLPAVDTLGSTTTIVSDKTGTLTQNRMTVRRLSLTDAAFEVTGSSEDITGGALVRDGERAGPPSGGALYYLLLTGLLCNNVSVYPDNQSSRTNGESGKKGSQAPRFEGDPMEVALVHAARKAGMEHDPAQEQYEEVDRIPFRTEHRFMATVHRNSKSGETLVLIKGAPEVILDMCDAAMDESGSETRLDAGAIRNAQAELSGDGLRVLGFAIGRGEKAAASARSETPQGMTFTGLQGLLDPPRESAIQAVDRCHEAGIRVIMVTGDHATTAAAIARKVHLHQSEVRPGATQPKMRDDRQDALPVAVAGQTIAETADEKLDAMLADINVFARVKPNQKTRIVDHLKNRGEIVAVTGDGVNDAPALKSAHIGAAMGSGTDVAKEASDMVVTDDDFASVYAAVEEGRTAFRNIRMATFFLLSTGAADVLIILYALFAGWPLPLLPAQILWCNVVTNGIADVALAFEPGEHALFRRPPRPTDEGVLDRILIERLGIVGIWLAAGTLFMFFHIYGGSEDRLHLARTAALTTLVLFQKVHVFNCRSEDVSLFRKSLFANKLLFAGVMASLAIHVAALYIPVTQELLRFEPLDLKTWILAAAVAASAIILNEGLKILRPRRRELYWSR